MLGVSCSELDSIVSAAKENGALGAKLSGKGRGGVAIILLEKSAQKDRMTAALEKAGSVSTYYTEL